MATDSNVTGKRFSDLLPLFQGHSLARVAMWHVNALLQEGLAPEMWLTPHELSAIADYKSERRRKEWMVSRIALKRLLLQDGIVRSPLHAEIRKNELGCPRVFIAPPDAPASDFACSIAHKNLLVVAGYALQGAHIGIDIERRSWRLQHVRRHFVAPNDRLMEGEDSIAKFAALWAFKEATSKLLGVGYACGFTRITCRETSPGTCEVIAPNATVLEGHFTWAFGKYVIALVMDVCPRERIPSAPLPTRPWFEQWRRLRRLKRLRRLRALAAISTPLKDPHRL